MIMKLMAHPKLNVSVRMGLSYRFDHCAPMPCSSQRTTYLKAIPNAVVEHKDCNRKEKKMCKVCKYVHKAKGKKMYA